jgi:UDPglucose 6-dehydrogenase
MKENISVIGVGRLGLAFALLVNSKGYKVMGCDVNERYINSLVDKSFKSKEPQIDELLAQSTVAFTNNTLATLNYADIIFVFVPTPSLADGSYNHKYVDQVVSKIETFEIKDKTLVIGCTVMPRYCERLKERLKELNINVVYNPEFIAQGSIVDGLRDADIVLIGGYAPFAVYEMYRQIMGREPQFKTLTPTGAEIAKMAINGFLTLKIAYGNLIGEIINSSWEQGSVDDILDAIGSDSRIGNKCLKYGFPAGGVCLPRDQKALNHYAYKVGIDTTYFHAIDNENQRHSEYLVRYYTNENPDKSVPFVFSYLGYKKGVDILTDSFQLKVCIHLLRAGYKVSVPESVKDMDTPEEFKDYIYNDKVIFGNAEGYQIN